MDEIPKPKKSKRVYRAGGNSTPVLVPDRATAVYYSPETADRIVNEYLAGQSLHKISCTDGYPSYASILRWASENEAFRKRLEAARAIRALHFEEQAWEAANEPTNKDEVPQAKLKVDTAIWLASVNDKSKYGKTTTIEGNPDKPISFTIVTGVPKVEEKAPEKIIEAEVVDCTQKEDT